MDIVFLATAKRDLRWFRSYYVRTFPEGGGKANQEFLGALERLSAFAESGPVSLRIEGARELRVQRTPFTFIYRIKTTRIEILRVVDERSD